MALRAPLLGIPFERDEGEYAYIAWRLGHNELPYRDWVDQKPPAIFWVYRLALALPFDDIRSVHLVALLFALASASALYFAARRLTGSPWATASALLFTLLAAGPAIQGTAANTELFMLLPVILANLLYLKGVADGGSDAKTIFAIGVLNGVAMMFKQVAGVNWLFLMGASPLLYGSGRRLLGMAGFALWSLLGVVAPWGLVAGYFFARGALADFVYNVFTHNLEYVRSIPLAERLENLQGTLSALAPSQALVWLFCAAGLVAASRSRRTPLFLFLAGWGLSAAVGVSASGYYFPHYFQQLLPPLALLAVCGARMLYEARFWGEASAWLKGGICAVAVAALPCYAMLPFIFSYTPEEAVRRIYPGNSFAEMPEYGRVLSAITRPEDRVFIFGAEPELLFYARRASATRYIFLFPLYGPYSDSLQKQRETAREITEARPAVALYRPNALFFEPGTEQFFTHWTESFLAMNYQPRTFVLPGNHQIEFFLRR